MGSVRTGLPMRNCPYLYEPRVRVAFYCLFYCVRILGTCSILLRHSADAWVRSVGLGCQYCFVSRSHGLLSLSLYFSGPCPHRGGGGGWSLSCGAPRARWRLPVGPNDVAWTRLWMPQPLCRSSPSFIREKQRESGRERDGERERGGGGRGKAESGQQQREGGASRWR